MEHEDRLPPAGRQRIAVGRAILNAADRDVARAKRGLSRFSSDENGTVPFAATLTGRKIHRARRKEREYKPLRSLRLRGKLS